MSDLDAFPPAPVTLEIDGQSIDITPIRVGEIPGLLAAMQPFADHLSADPDWLALFCKHGESLISALALAARRERRWIAELSIDNAIRLATVVFEVNADFFVQRVVPAVKAAAARLAKAPAGAMPSTGSSAPDTATPTS
jgi:hypothetical protein